MWQTMMLCMMGPRIVLHVSCLSYVAWTHHIHTLRLGCSKIVPCCANSVFCTSPPLPLSPLLPPPPPPPPPPSFSLDEPESVDSTTIAGTPETLLVSRVSWTEPVSNNADITNYTVQVCSTETEDCRMYNTFQPEAAVLALPTVVYNVSVTANNIVGFSVSDITTIMGTNEG